MLGYFGDRYKTVEKKKTGERNIFVYDDLNNLVCLIREQKIRNVKHITVYEDESESRAVIHLESGKEPDITGTGPTQPDTGRKYSVYSAGRTDMIGKLQQHGYKWHIMDNQDNEIAELKKRNPLEMIKDHESSFVPGKYIIEMKKPDRVVAEIRKDFSFFSKRHHLDFTRDHAHVLDRRLGLSAFVAHMLREKQPKKKKEKKSGTRTQK